MTISVKRNRRHLHRDVGTNLELDPELELDDAMQMILVLHGMEGGKGE